MTREVLIVRRRIGAAFLLGIVVVARSGCSAPDTPPVTLAEGEWGGEHMRLEVQDSVALAEFDCAHGRLTVPILLLDNQFVSDGWFTPEHGGPIREGERVTPLRARYSGSVTGNRMTITVRLTDEARSAGTFYLQRGSGARVFKCL
jgi:hypothetical protein